MSSDAPSYFSRAPPPPQGIYEKTVTWISRNRTTIVAVTVFAGTTAYLVQRKKKAQSKKRRAKKLPNGAKKEIVILACPTFHDPLTKSLAVDLERRGYVVYVTVSSTEEDSLVQQEAKADLRPLWMDLTSTVPNPAVDIHPNLEPIRELLASGTMRSSPSSSRVGAGSSMNNLTLAGIVVFPGCSGYPEGSLALLPPSDVIDTINTRLVAPMITLQQFLPLLARHSTDSTSPSSIIIAYPSIPKALSPSKQIPETVVASSMSALASSLSREVTSMEANITVHELKLGNFDLGSIPGAKGIPQIYQQSSSTGRLDPANSALTHWHSSQRAAIQRTSFGQQSLIKGSAARELHNAVFDALAPPQVFKAFGRYEWQTRKSSSTMFVGSGARVYDFVGGWVPGSIVGLVLALRNRNAPKDEFPRFTEQSSPKMNESSYGGGSAGSESAMWEKL